MARWPQKQQEVRVTPSAPAPAPASTEKVAPTFDFTRPHTDAHEGQQKYWVQNGWLYTRGTARPVREV